MPWLRGLFVLLLCLGSPLRADIANDYAIAFNHYYPQGTKDQRVLDSAAFIPRLEGTWLSSELLFQDGSYDDVFAENACQMIATQIAPKGKFGFTATRLNKGTPTGVQYAYTWQGNNTFTRLIELDSYLQDLFRGADIAEQDDATLRRLLTSPSLINTAIIRPFGDDVLIIEPVGGAPEILTRCPT